jgi:hypothetical protein
MIYMGKASHLSTRLLNTVVQYINNSLINKKIIKKKDVHEQSVNRTLSVGHLQYTGTP